MPRVRQIKPEFFVDEEVALLNHLARLLFIGLWTVADSAGRLEDRPGKIRAQLLPFDDVDINELLRQLTERNFIIRYEVHGKKYIQIRTFTKHQHCHHREPESTIPPPSVLSEKDRKIRRNAETSLRRAPGQPQAYPGQAPGKTEASPSTYGLRNTEYDLQNTAIDIQNTDTSQAYACDPTALELAESLRDAIHQRDPEAKAGKLPNLPGWIHDIEKLMRIDNRTPEEIREVIAWCQSPDCFWGPNILSGRKLRDKFDTLRGQMRQAKPGGKDGERWQDCSRANQRPGGEDPYEQLGATVRTDS